MRPTPRTHLPTRSRPAPVEAVLTLSLLLAIAACTLAAFPARALPAPSPSAAPWALPPASASQPLPALPRLPPALDAPQPYRPQRFCDPTAKPGTLALAALLERTYPHTGSDGIVRACHLGGRSEHKEGRAFDWAADVRIPREAASAGRFLRWLTALDAAGTPVMARRMGVEYIIYDRHSWSVRDPRWKPYAGRDPHLDHAHITLSWAGARGQTSFWSGRAAPADPGPPIPVIGLDAARLPRAPLSMGAAGEAVEVLRILLRIDSPRPPGAATPARDPLRAPALDQRTYDALRALQARHRLPVTGVADRRSFEAARREFHARPPAKPTLPAKPAPSAKPTAAPRPSTTPAAPRPSRRPVLRRGDRGPAVAELQDLLGMRPPASSRGVFGPHTHERVTQLQRSEGLTPDGVVGPRTWAVLLHGA